MDALALAIDDYLAHCTAKGLSRKTVDDNYALALKRTFLPWAQAQGIAELDQLTPRVIDRFAAGLRSTPTARGKPRSEATVATYVEAVNWWLRWLHQEGDLKAAVRGTPPKRRGRIVEVLSREEILDLERAADSERDKVLIRLLADTGLRLGEALALTQRDLIESGRRRYVRVRHRQQLGGAKGDSARDLQISPELHRRLIRLARGDRDARIFVSRRRRPDGTYAPLGLSGVEQMVREVAHRAEIGRRVHPHLFRHSFATHLLKQGADMGMVARLMGHQDTSMVFRTYGHITASDIGDRLLELLRD